MSFEITHITSAHTRTDVRIFVRMCKSLVGLVTQLICLFVTEWAMLRRME